MKILYGTAPDGVCLRRCFGLDREIHLPDFIGGKPVTQLGAYLFSDAMERAGILRQISEPLFLWDEEEGSIPVENFLTCGSVQGLPAVGSALTSLTLPSGIRRIGAYALYGCSSLTCLDFPLSVPDWGAGVFTGCSGLKLLRVRPGSGEKTCLKEVLFELHQTLEVEFLGEKDQEIKARVVLPEFYEESVENTPARIVCRQMHGCGHMYRYCFENGIFSFREYDRLFSYMKAEETPLLATRMALYRLHWPKDLGIESREGYRCYLEEHPRETSQNLLLPRCGEIFRRILEEPGLSRSMWENLIREAEEKGLREEVALLMEVFNRRFGKEAQPSRKRKFEL